jgi:hypothetical protein
MRVIGYHVGEKEKAKNVLLDEGEGLFWRQRSTKSKNNAIKNAKEKLRPIWSKLCGVIYSGGRQYTAGCNTPRQAMRLLLAQQPNWRG